MSHDHLNRNTGVRGAVASLADERAVPNGEFHAERALMYIEALYFVPAVRFPFDSTSQSHSSYFPPSRALYLGSYFTERYSMS